MAAQAQAINQKVDQAYQHARSDQQRARKIWVYERVQIVQQERTLVRCEPGACFEEIFSKGERAWPRPEFRNNAVDDRGDMQRGKQGARSRNQCAKSTHATNPRWVSNIPSA